MRQPSVSSHINRLASGLELEAVLGTLLDSAFALVPHLREAGVFLHRDGRFTLEARRPRDAPAPGQGDAPPGHPILEAIQKGEIVALPDIQADPRFADSPSPLKGALVCAPIKIGTSVVGAINLYLDQPHVFHETELRSLRALGAQAAAAIQNAQMIGQIMENISDMIVIVNADATIRYASPSVEHNLGHRPDDLIGRSIFNYIHADDARMVAARLKQQAGGRRLAVESEVLCQHRDGSWRVVEANSSNLLRDPAIGGILITARNITGRKQIEDELRFTEARSRSLLAAIPDLMFEVSPECLLVDYRAANPDDLPALSEQVIGKHVREVLPPDLVDPITVAMGVAAASGEAQIVEYRLETKRGMQHFEARLTPTSFGNLLFIIRNITDRKQAEIALRESEERYMLAVRGANDGLWDWDLRNGRIYYSPRWKAILGFEENEIDDTPGEWFSRVHADDIERIEVDIASHVGGITPFFVNEHRLQHKDGAYRWVLARGLAVRDAGRKAHRMAGSLTDITDRKSAEEQLVHNALHDSLTDLPNRVYFIDQVKRLLERNRRRGDFSAAVMFIDLDGFKSVNDTLGHASGDKLLVAIARRLESCLRPGDTVSRFGGDEFAVLLEDVRHPGDAVRIAERIQAEVSKPVELPGRSMITTASIGIAHMEEDYERPEDVLRDADAAMYQAKINGKAQYVFFDPASQTGRLTYTGFDHAAPG